MNWLTEAGLGLDHAVLDLRPTHPSWVAAGRRLVAEVADSLDACAAGVEQIGSSSVEGLLAKPIVDIAVAVSSDRQTEQVHERLVSTGWVYRGDAGDKGGHVFVLESAPGRRVAHIHVVHHAGDQWRDYLVLRDLLRRSPEARAWYEATKRDLAARLGHDRVAYTEGKTDVVRSLLTMAEAEADAP